MMAPFYCFFIKLEQAANVFIAIFTVLFMIFIRKIRPIVSNALLLAVYATFFGVQLFFNFEKFPGEGLPFKSASQLGSSDGSLSGSQRVSERSHSPVNPKTTIRLNKRFQKENIPPIALTGNDFPKQYALFICAIPFGQYHDRLSSWLSSSGNSLRGPPFVV